jgi:transcription elongation factor Elf1
MTVRVFISDNNKATFQCPECGTGKTVDVSRYKDTEAAVRVKCRCRCGHKYTAILERRKYYRKDTDLPGTYRFKNKGGKMLMTVINISRTGLQLKINDDPEIKSGDNLRLEFRLNDSNHSLIEIDVVVHAIRGKNIGCEFRDDYSSQLGSYLLK